MNFTTDLPKKNPIVSYIVASAVKCEKFFPECAKEGPAFRMHAVILTKKGLLTHPQHASLTNTQIGSGASVPQREISSFSNSTA
jgi:hypothetical protein